MPGRARSILAEWSHSKRDFSDYDTSIKVQEVCCGDC